MCAAMLPTRTVGVPEKLDINIYKDPTFVCVSVRARAFLNEAVTLTNQGFIWMGLPVFGFGSELDGLYWAFIEHVFSPFVPAFQTKRA